MKGSEPDGGGRRVPAWARDPSEATAAAAAAALRKSRRLVMGAGGCCEFEATWRNSRSQFAYNPGGNTRSCGLLLKMSTTHFQVPFESFFQMVTPFPKTVRTFPVVSANVMRLCS